MDTLRNDEEREINHHGKTITINEDNDNDDSGGNVLKVLRKIKRKFL